MPTYGMELDTHQTKAGMELDGMELDTQQTKAISRHSYCTLSLPAQNTGLCGRDQRTGQCFEHRRQWIEDRILALGQIFALDICAYAVMSNHYHVVLHINAALASDWNLHEVAERWHRLCKGSSLSQRFVRDEKLDSAELARLVEVAELWRRG